MELHKQQECKAIYELFYEIIHFHQLMSLERNKFNIKRRICFVFLRFK
jgi:hypothetical protein